MAYLGSNANQTVELRSTRFRFTATEGQTTFSGNDAIATDSIRVYSSDDGANSKADLKWNAFSFHGELA